MTRCDSQGWPTYAAALARCTLFVLSVWAMMISAAASAGDITAISSQNIDNTTQITVRYSDKSDPPRIFVLSEGAPRIVVDFKKSRPKGLGDSPYPGVGATQGIRYAPRGRGTRIVLDLRPGAKLLSKDSAGGVTTISLSRPNAGSAAAPVSPVAMTAPIIIPIREAQKDSRGTPIPRVKPIISSLVARKPIIVIDPGHGGYDPGAVGKSGTREKAITLKAAQELKAHLVATGRYEVMLTRDKDVFVELDQRVRMARMKEADLFISIHADSLDNSATRGASVYTLADYARKRSTKLVSSQNWIMDVDLTEEHASVGNILVDLAQRKTFSNSDKLAGMLVTDLGKVTTLLRNTHRRKGLAVLLAPDVPAVLIELGFLSNAQDETLLNNAAHRRKTTRAIADTIDRYFSAQMQ